MAVAGVKSSAVGGHGPPHALLHRSPNICTRMRNVETNGKAQERESTNVYVTLAGSRLHVRVDCCRVRARPAGSTYSGHSLFSCANMYQFPAKTKRFEDPSPHKHHHHPSPSKNKNVREREIVLYSRGKPETEHLCLRQPIHGIGRSRDPFSRE